MVSYNSACYIRYHLFLATIYYVYFEYYIYLPLPASQYRFPLPLQVQVFNFLVSWEPVI